MKVLAQFSASLFFRMVFFIGSVMAPQVAISAEAEKDSDLTGAFFKYLSSIGDEIDKRSSVALFDTLKSSALTTSGEISTWALYLAGSLATFYVLFYCLKKLLTGGNTPLINIVADGFIPAIMTSMLITNYANIIEDFAKLYHLFQGIGPSSISGIIKYFGQILQMMGVAIVKQLVAFSAAVKTSPTGLIGWVAETFAIIAIILMMLKDMLGSLTTLLTLIIKPMFFFAVGVAIGPFAIAGLSTPWTVEYFKRWALFMTNTAVLAGMIAICLKLSQTVMDNFMLNMFVEDTPVFVSLACSMICMMAINELISDAVGITNALVPGQLPAAGSSGEQALSRTQQIAGAAMKGSARVFTARAQGNNNIKRLN